jgi:hypothetical protein
MLRVLRAANGVRDPSRAPTPLRRDGVAPARSAFVSGVRVCETCAMSMREDCRHFAARTYDDGETARFCVLDLAPKRRGVAPRTARATRRP